MRYLGRSTNLVYKLPDSEVLIPSKLKNYEFVILDKADVNFYFARRDVDSWRNSSYLRALEAGCFGFMAREGSQWAAVQWISPPGSFYPTHLPKEIVRDEYWCFNEHTHIAHRRQGLWSALKSFGVNYSRQHAGTFEQSVYSDTGTNNIASRIAHEKIGFIPEGIIEASFLRIPRMTTISRGKWDRKATHPAFKSG